MADSWYALMVIVVLLALTLVQGNALSLITGIIAAGLYGNIGISLVSVLNS